jgi:hypothetical protein
LFDGFRKRSTHPTSYIAEQGYVLPLLQYAQPILYNADLAVTHNTSGALLPASTIAKT